MTGAAGGPGKRQPKSQRVCMVVLQGGPGMMRPAPDSRSRTSGLDPLPSPEHRRLENLHFTGAGDVAQPTQSLLAVSIAKKKKLACISPAVGSLHDLEYP